MKRRRRLLVLLALPVAFLLALPWIVDAIGGAWSRAPQEMPDGLSAETRAVVDAAYHGIDPARLFDYHVHLVGLGAGGTGCFVHPGMRSWWHVTRRVQFVVYKSAAGITDETTADQQYVNRLVDLLRHKPMPGRSLLLAFDRHYDEDGSVRLDNTEMHTPNIYAEQIAGEHADLFAVGCSVHPYRPDALEELERCAQQGARIVKWLPNAMGMNPADPRCDPFYAVMKKHGMALLTHAGEEKAVDSAEDQKLGNPLLLRRPLDAGVRVIVAHCASLAENPDLDTKEQTALVPNFDLFLRLMDDPRYKDLVFGEISATTQRNRMKGPLRTLLTRTDLHDRLVNGSDYPLPAVNVLIHVGMLVDEGLLQEHQAVALREIYDVNPIAFDFVLKRSLRGPGGERFPASMFHENPLLRAAR
ncbi:MAG: amidohydrolase family protein [Planctomycetota bacterium]